LSTLLQIVPRVPGGIDGVGDYALTIAERLRAKFGCDTLFATFKTSPVENAAGFEVLSLDGLLDDVARKYDHTLLHYVNYGFQKRGIPFRLLSILRALRKRRQGKLVTIFHELYASGPPWKSAFWLHPVQKQIAIAVAKMSDTCIVSSESMLEKLQALVPGGKILVRPVTSNFGEPALSVDQFAQRDPHRWVICGGTALVERSVRSLRAIADRIPDAAQPRQLFVLGGNDNPTIRSLLVDLGNVQTDYRPRIAVSEASPILSSCSFAWVDYFHRPGVATAVVLKSSAFASLYAHGVIPVFSEAGSEISIGGDPMPGPFFVGASSWELPSIDRRASTAAAFYDWYHRHASIEHLTNGIAGALGLNTES
jgi:hypothetical protein